MCIISYSIQMTPVSVCRSILRVCTRTADLIIHIRICPFIRALSFIPGFDRFLRVFRYSQVKAMYASSKDHTVSLVIPLRFRYQAEVTLNVQGI